MILQNGKIQIFKQVKNGFKKVILPPILGKSVNVISSEYVSTSKQKIERKQSSFSKRKNSEKNILMSTDIDDYKKITHNFLQVLSNKMIFVKDLGYIIHEMKGTLFAYKISSDDFSIRSYKCLETYVTPEKVQFLVSESNSCLKLLTPEKEFAFGTPFQLVSDTPQFRMQDPLGAKLRRITYYKSLKSEEFLIIGAHKETENFKEIVVPPIEIEEKPQAVIIKPFLLEKEGFESLKPILPMNDVVIKGEEALRFQEEQRKVAVVEKFQTVQSVPITLAPPVVGLRPVINTTIIPKIPIVNKAGVTDDINLIDKPVDIITANIRNTNDAEEMKLNVRLPPTHNYELFIFNLTGLLKFSHTESDLKPEKLEVPEDSKDEEKPEIILDPIKGDGDTNLLCYLPSNGYDITKFMTMEKFPLKPNEIILDLKKVTLISDKGSKGDYFSVSTSIINPTCGEDGSYKARIIIFEILHQFEKIAEVNEKRCASVIDCCRGFLLSSTEGPEMSSNTLGFKVQLYKLSKIRKKILDPNPTEPTKIMATTINVIDDLVLFADIRKGFNVMTVQNQENSIQPTVRRTYECYNDIIVTDTELWNISKDVTSKRIDCVAVIATDNNLLQIYTSLYNTMQLKAEINIGRKVTCIKKTEEDHDSKHLAYFTQQGSVGMLSQISTKTEKLYEEMTFKLSGKVPWQSGLSPLHLCYFPEQNYKDNFDWRKSFKKFKKGIANLSELNLLHEFPHFIQQEILKPVGLNVIDFAKIV